MMPEKSGPPQGIAPRRVRVGKHIRYRRADLDAWVERSYADATASPRTPAPAA